jgi:desulfoferrodoxin (superoxide reductase-like protein)
MSLVGLTHLRHHDHHVAWSTLKMKPAPLHREVAGVEEAVEVEVEEVQAVSTYSKTSSGTDLYAR